MPTEYPCAQGEPLIKLDANGTAPILNYSLPQDTSFTAYGTISMGLPASHFTDKAKLIPAPVVANPTPTRSENDFIIPPSGTYNLQAWGVAVLNSAEVQMLHERAQAFRLERYREGLAGKEQLGTAPPMMSVEQAWKIILQQYLEGYNPALIAAQVNQGYALQIESCWGGGKRITYYQRPTTGTTVQATPQLYFIEEYVTVSYARDYGAGKTLQIHSLFPGEKTSVTIKTFKELKTVKSQAENVIDSFSQESARELENLLENETNNGTNKTRGGGVNLNGNISGSVGKNASGEVGGNAHFSASNTRTSNTRSLSKSLSKSIDKSNSSRQININTSTQETQTESEEVATVRQFENINKSRVLNLAFRELLQEYVTITYLNDVKIAFSNGNAEHDLIYSIESVHELLETHIIEAQREDVKNRILFEYNHLYNESNEKTVTVEGIETEPYKGLIMAFHKDNYEGESIRYLRKNPKLRSIYHVENDTARKYEVAGILLNVKHYTLRTPAVVVDAFLGHGEALDCYSVALQQESVKKAQLENAKVEVENAKLMLENTIRGNREPLEQTKITKETERLEAETVIMNTLLTYLGDGQISATDFAQAISKLSLSSKASVNVSYTNND